MKIARFLVTPDFLRDLLHLPLGTEIVWAGMVAPLSIELTITHPDLHERPACGGGTAAPDSPAVPARSGRRVARGLGPVVSRPTRAEAPSVPCCCRLSPAELERVNLAAKLNHQTRSQFRRDALVTVAEECLEDPRTA